MNNRTHMCGEVTAEAAGQSVILKGWVQRARNLGGIVFVWLRDRSGIVQVVFDGNAISAQLLELAGAFLQRCGVVAHKSPCDSEAECRCPQGHKPPRARACLRNLLISAKITP